MELTERIEGYDANGIRRVWAISDCEAQIAAMEYVTHRPDTGPLDKWTFKMVRLDLDDN